jgi:hypothetical protein
MLSTTFPNHPLDATNVGEDEVLELLDRIDELLPSEKLVEIPEVRNGRALVIGDTHGDWPTLQSLVEKYLLEENGVEKFIILGDYVDRAPAGLSFASVTNAIYVLSLRALFPEKVILFRGNHEAYRDIPFQAHDLMDDAFQCWGTRGVGERIETLFGKLPLAGMTESGAFLAHAGYPIAKSWREAVLRPSQETLFQVLWNDVDVSPTCGGRGIDQEPIGSENLDAFLAESGAKVFVRGHDPAVVGQLLYDNRVLTVHTTRDRVKYGVNAAMIPLGGKLLTLSRSEIMKVDIPPLPSK